MLSTSGVLTTPNFEDGVRAVLLVIDIVGISLAFIDLRPAYAALGAIFGVSIIYNIVITLALSRQTRTNLRNGQPVRPNLPALALEVLGAVTFLVLFVVAVTDSVNGGRYSYDSTSTTFVRAYCAMSGLLASIFHGSLAMKRFVQYINYRSSLDNTCPHCHRGPGKASIPRPSEISPLALEGQGGPAMPRDSTSANSVGEGENDNLIMKE